MEAAVAAGYHPIEIIQGVTFELPVTYRDSKRAAYDIATFSAHFVVKSSLADLVPLVNLTAPADFTLDANTILTGTVDKVAGSRGLVGSGTSLQSLSPGDTISVPGGSGVERRLVDSVQNDLALTVRDAFRSSATGQVCTRVAGSFTVTVPETLTATLPLHLLWYELRLVDTALSPERRIRLLWGPALVRGAVDA